MQESSPANPMTPPAIAAQVQTRADFNFKAAHNLLDKAFDELQCKFYPAKDCPYGPEQWEDAKKLIALCEHVAFVFYNRSEGEVVL